MSEKCKYYPRRDSGKYIVYLNWQGKKYTRSNYDDWLDIETPKQAERLCSAINADIDRHKENFDPRMWFFSDRELQFSYAVDKWYSDKIYSASTIPNVERALYLAKEYFKNINIKTIRKAHLKEFLSMLESSEARRRTLMAHLKTALNDICDDWHLMRIPFPSISVPYKKKPWLPEEKQDYIIGYVPEGDQPIFRFMQVYGCRSSEACALQWQDIDRENKTIHICRTFSEKVIKETTKTAYERIIPLAQSIEAMIKPLRLDIRNQFVFKNRNGDHYRENSLWEIWRKACIRADVPHISVKNAFRVSKVTQLKEKYPIKLVSEFMGHKRVTTTEIYSQENVESLRGMVW